MATNANAPGEDLAKNFEGCELEAYWDPNGNCWTIGWGHTGPEVVQGLVWTQEQADAALDQDQAAARSCVAAHVTAPLTDDERGALVDFVFNEGCGRFAASTMLRKLNAYDYQGAAAEFERWDYAGGRQVAGLLRRRQAEETLFNQPDTSSGSQV